MSLPSDIITTIKDMGAGAKATVSEIADILDKDPGNVRQAMNKLAQGRKLKKILGDGQNYFRLPLEDEDLSVAQEVVATTEEAWAKENVGLSSLKEGDEISVVSKSGKRSDIVVGASIAETMEPQFIDPSMIKQAVADLGQKLSGQQLPTIDNLQLKVDVLNDLAKYLDVCIKPCLLSIRDDLIAVNKASRKECFK